jgi:hypothetical protein
MWAFYHPRAQEVLLGAAAAAGTEVCRGATVQHIAPGNKPKVKIAQANGTTEAADHESIASGGAQRGLTLQEKVVAENRTRAIRVLAFSGGLAVAGKTCCKCWTE